jgi:hypothetical protein
VSDGSAERVVEEVILKSAVLAWGSLVWKPRELKTAAPFAPDGPLLPIEFCRISDDGRLTLVIDETVGDVCTTYSTPSAFDDLDAALLNLWMREGPGAESPPRDVRRHGRVGFVEPASGRQSDVAMQRHPQVVATIAAWAESNGYDAAIWTALESNFDQSGKGGEPFSVTAALRYLETLERDDAAAFGRALTYIRNAPSEIQTPVRDEVAKRWPA